MKGLTLSTTDRCGQTSTFWVITRIDQYPKDGSAEIHFSLYKDQAAYDSGDDAIESKQTVLVTATGINFAEAYTHLKTLNKFGEVAGPDDTDGNPTIAKAGLDFTTATDVV